MNSFQSFLEHLKQPEYLHVLLNPLPIYGLLIGALTLAIALLVRSRPAQVTGLVLIFISAAAAWPVYAFGERGYHNIYVSLEVGDQAWLDDHMHRAEKAIYVLYGLAACALSAILWPKRFSKTVAALKGTTLALAFGSLAVAGWIASAGGKVRHSEFR